MRTGIILAVLMLCVSSPPETRAQTAKQQVSRFGVGKYGPSQSASRLRMRTNRLQKHRLRNISPGQTATTRRQVLQRNRNDRNIRRAGQVRLRDINRPVTITRSERQRRERSQFKVRRRYLASDQNIRLRSHRTQPIVTSN